MGRAFDDQGWMASAPLTIHGHVQTCLQTVGGVCFVICIEDALTHSDFLPLNHV